MRITDNIFLISGYSNSYLIDREYYCILIDTGGSRKAKKIINAIKNYCPNKPLKAIIITHAHLDHMGGLETLGLLYGSEIISHKSEKKYIMNLEKIPTEDTFKGRILSIFYRLFSPKSYTVDRIVVGGEVIYGLKIHSVPGHTPGTIALEDLETGILFSSDTLGKSRKNNKIYMPHGFFASNFEEALKSSIKLLKTTNPKSILPGHGSPYLEPEIAIKEYLEKMDR